MTTSNLENAAPVYERAKDKHRKLDDDLDVQRLHLGPGDTLVILSERPIDLARKARIWEDMDRLFPEHKTLILDNGMKIAVLGPEE